MAKDRQDKNSPRKELKLCGVCVFLPGGLRVKLFWLVQVRGKWFF
jgi:hypothetical protein